MTLVVALHLKVLFRMFLPSTEQHIMNLTLAKLIPLLAAGVPAVHVWLNRYTAAGSRSEHLPRLGEADRIPRPGAFALLSGYVPD